MKKASSLIVFFLCLWGCNPDNEFEIKRNFSYTLIKQEILTHRLFTAGGEITDPNIIASIFARVEEENPLKRNFPENTNTFDFDFSISFLSEVAVLNQNDNFDTLKIKTTDNIILLESDTIQSITGTFNENHLTNKIQKYPINVIDKEIVPLSYGFGEKLTFTYEYVIRPSADKLTMQRLFYYYYNSFFPNGGLFAAEITNELNTKVYQYLDQGDTLLVNEINWIFE